MRAALLSIAAGVVFGAADPLANPGFQHFYNLEYDQALADFRAQAAADPASADALNHIAQTILFRQMFRSGSLETDLIGAANSFLRRPRMPLSGDDQQEFSDAANRAIEIATERVKRNPADAAALYSLGVSYGIRANYEFLVKKAWINALSDAASARRMHARVLELNPKLIDAQLIPGVQEYVVASLPWALRMVSAVGGASGDHQHAIAAIRNVAQSGDINRFDAEALLAAIYRREKRPREAIPPLEDLRARFPRAYLLRLELAEAYAAAGDRVSALAQVDEVERIKQTNAPGYARVPEAKIRYTRGDVLFESNQLDRALEEMLAASAAWRELDPVTAGQAWLRLGEIYDLQGRRSEAVAAYSQARTAAPDSDAAGEAKGYIWSRYKRQTGG